MNKKELRRLIRKEIKQILDAVLIEQLVRTTIRETMRQGAGVGMDPGISPSVNSMPSNLAKKLKVDDDDVPIGEGMSFKDRIRILADLPRGGSAMDILSEGRINMDDDVEDDDDIDKLVSSDLTRG